MLDCAEKDRWLDLKETVRIPCRDGLSKVAFILDYFCMDEMMVSTSTYSDTNLDAMAILSESSDLILKIILLIRVAISNASSSTNNKGIRVLLNKSNIF